MTDRVNQTMDRLISNLPQAIELLKEAGKHNLAWQINNDLDNLRYWQRNGGLIEKETHITYWPEMEATND